MELIERYERIGQTLDELTVEMKDLDAATQVLTIDGDEIGVLSPFGWGSNQKVATFHFIEEQTVLNMMRRHSAKCGFPTLEYARPDNKESQWGLLQDEMWKHKGFMIYSKESGKLLYISKAIINGLCRAAGTSWTPKKTKPGETLFRDTNILLGLRGEKLRLLVREAQGLTKAFHLFGGKYIYQPNSFLLEVIDELLHHPVFGEGQVVHWRSTHHMTMARVEYASMAQSLQQKWQLRTGFIPGFSIYNSQTGECGFVIALTLRPTDAKLPLCVESKSFLHSVHSVQKEVVIATANGFSFDSTMKRIHELAAYHPIPLGEIPEAKKMLGADVFQRVERQCAGSESGLEMLTAIAKAAYDPLLQSVMQTKWAEAWLGKVPEYLLQMSTRKEGVA